MKKTLFILLILTLLLSLASCAKDVEKEVFFSEEVLASLDVSQIPTPKLENSRRSYDGMTLYLNLAEDEYESYALSVGEYLSSREDVFNFGNLYKTGSFPVFMFIMVPTYHFEYVNDGYDYSADEHNFVFSKTPEIDYNLNGDYKYSFNSPTKIQIIRSEYSFKEKDGLIKKNFEYNTVIKLSAETQVSFYKEYLCRDEHTFGEGKIDYDNQITVYTCEVCGSAKSEDLGSEYFLSLDTLLPDLSNTVSIRYEYRPLKAAPGSFKRIYYTENEEDIKECLSILSAEVVKINGEYTEAEGGIENEYVFYTDSADYTLTVKGGIINIGGTKYKYLGRIYTPQVCTKESLSFVTHNDSYKIYESGVLIEKRSGLSDIEFVEYTGPITLNIPIRYAECEFGILKIYTSKIFALERNGEVKYYEIISEHTLY